MELLNTRMLFWEENIPTGIAEKMDMIVLNKNTIIYNKPLTETKTIFINTKGKGKLILYFIDNILQQLTNPVNIIIGGSDFTFPNNIDRRAEGHINHSNEFINFAKHKMINKLFVENLDENIENAIPIPLGINPRECPTNINYFLKFEKINHNKPLKITNFNRVRTGRGQWQERGDVNKLCNTVWKDFCIHSIVNDYDDTNKNENHKEYLKQMSSYLFTICVHGGGLDVNPKLWEALLVGVIPIIRENKPYTDIYKTLDFPVVIVKKWDVDTINKNNLIKWYNKYYNYFKDRRIRKNMLRKLSLDYWVNYVKKFE